MRFTRWRAVGIAVGVAFFSFLSGPSSAVGSVSITDATGIDYDPSCIVGIGITPPPANGAAPCTGLSTYDGSAAGIDLTGVSLGSNAAGQFTATFNVAGGLPAPGSSNLADLDLPSSNFVGGTYYAMFQNKNVQNNVPTNPLGGCPRFPTGNVFDQHGAWQDGYHFWLAFGVNWDGAQWIYSVTIGEYDPSPDGAFFFNEVGTNDGTWHDADPNMVKGVNWDATVSTSPTGPSTVTLTIDGILKTQNPNCAPPGVFKTVFGKAGDAIENVKGFSTADVTLTLPVVVPLSSLCSPTGGLLCESDLKSVGGFILGADTTVGNSTAGLLGQNISGIAFTRGLLDHHIHLIDLPDTLGDGPTCPTPTVGGTLPPNPLFTPGVACQIDDDAIARGTILPEFWDTGSAFTF